MKLKFKVQPYQTNAVDSVVDVFAGQVPSAGFVYRIDPGMAPADHQGMRQAALGEKDGFKNADIQLSAAKLLENIHAIQRRQNLPLSEKLIDKTGTSINLDIEMETGTGKTYCYIKSIFEMNKRYGWSKFIIMVPSIAIREGVAKSLEITAEHFTESYHKKARFFIYNSKRLHELESFSSDAGINVMIINIQAFAAAGKDNRRIYEELDDFQSRRPIDVISSNRPIIILDEPQKMEGPATLTALPKFNPLMILRYSATHKTTHNKIHRLDALDAYNQKLVKKIAVRGISVKGLAGTNAYLYLESIEVSKKAPVARIEIEMQLKTGAIVRKLLRLSAGDNLYAASNELDQYRDFIVSQIDYTQDSVEFTNGHKLIAGEATGDITEATIRRIQIRETIKAHIEKEKQLFAQGIKVLSLFFIDEVAKYRDYSQENANGEYATIFEEEYQQIKQEYLSELELDNVAYRDYLRRDSASKVHEGYFAIDKNKKMANPSVKARGEDAGLSDDVDAYDLILKNKERLLSTDEPVRFIFSHSALREGWDNPNVFVMCMLKHSDNTLSRRQEVGRGLRLSVNKDGDRMDHPATVHEINVLTVVASESYKDFVTNLQREMSDSLSARPKQASKEYFAGKVLKTANGDVTVTDDMATDIEFYLIQNGYVDKKRNITDKYHEHHKESTLAELPSELAPYSAEIIKLINGVFSEAQLDMMVDDRRPKKNPLNANFDKKEFQELWNRINKKVVYKVDFDSAELVRKSISALDSLRVTPLQYTVQTGIQNTTISDSDLKQGDSFKLKKTTTDTHNASIHSAVRYDLLAKLGDNAKLTRSTVAAILTGITPAIFAQFKLNPEHFIAEASRIINEQKATMVIESLHYDEIEGEYHVDIFTANQSKQDFSNASQKLNNHIYDYAITDSKVERAFVTELDTSTEVVVYAKLPKGFLIPTPVGDYNPDWAITFKEGTVQHIYFVAETKGTMSTMELREVEKTKIQCASKFFHAINQKITHEKVKYDVVTDFGKLMEVVGLKAALQ